MPSRDREPVHFDEGRVRSFVQEQFAQHFINCPSCSIRYTPAPEYEPANDTTLFPLTRVWC